LDEPRDENQENPVSTRTKSLGVAAAFAAMIVAVPTTFQAYAEPTPTPTPSPAAESSPAAEASPAAPAPESSPAAPAPASTTVPVPTSTKVPDPQGPGCDAYRKANPAGTPGSIESMALKTGSQALASNPELSTFSDAISGKLNPAINIVNVLDGGPYVVFAPTNAAFAKLDAATLNTLKTDPVVLLPTLFYHMVLGYLGPNDVQGKMPTQDGRSVTVTGKGGEIKVNDVRVTCAFATRGAYIYMIDEVLTPPTPAAEAGGSTTPTTTPTTTTTPTASPTTTAAPTTTASPTASPTTTAPSPAEQTATPATTPAASATPTTTKAAA
jgi:uncharacterized surface protein with fasciclin (FAS1) repeats